MADWQMQNYDFEENFDVDSWVKWTDSNWISLTFPVVVFYVYLVFIGRNWMSPLEPFNLRRPLLAWNVLLAVFSIIGSLRDSPVMLSIVYRDGWHASICDSKYYQAKYRSIWLCLFVFSKILELGDTLFVVLRKQKLAFLHWYHHATVVIFAFYMFGGRTPVSRWFVCMNLIVHSIMYTYYAFRAAGFKPPTFIPMSITTLQILQMTMGTFFISYALAIKQSGGRCDITDGRIAYGLLTYTSFGVLFAYFFYMAHLKLKPRPSRAKTK